MRKTKVSLWFGLLLASLTCGMPAMAPAQAETGAESTPTSTNGFDIAGVRIGMTADEARTALLAFDPGFRVTVVMSAYNYRDGARMLTTPEFLDKLEAKKQGSSEGVQIYFSGPVGGVRVIAVYRSALVPQNPPSSAQFARSLIEKFGTPSGINGRDMGHIVWEEQGKPSCIKVRDGQKTSLSVTPLALMGSVDEFYGKRSAQPLWRGMLPADLTECGAVIDYNLGMSDPVRGFTAELKDYGAIVANERSRKAWVNQLQEEAIREREGQGQTPRL